MTIKDSIQLAKNGFETSFLERKLYEKQTVDDNHLNLLMNMIDAQKGDVILDLGTGTGYIAFPLAKKYSDSTIIGLDIVTETLKRNEGKACKDNLDNLKFESYEGIDFPHKDNSVDTIITRYALHHFPDLKSSIKEMYRILRPDGKIIISDPTPNENDASGFVDKFMQMKPDGHIKFYPLDEYKELFDSEGFHFLSSKLTDIRFSRKEAEKYYGIMEETNREITAGYDLEIQGDEIWITEKVLNMIFVK